MNKLLESQPEAIDIREEGNCHCGAKNSLLSYRLPNIDDISYISQSGRFKGVKMMHCGFFCNSCGFSNAGSRPLTEQ